MKLEALNRDVEKRLSAAISGADKAIAKYKAALAKLKDAMYLLSDASEAREAVDFSKITPNERHNLEAVMAQCLAQIKNLKGMG